MALKGNLEHFTTTQLLNLINLARKTGTLTIQVPNMGQDEEMARVAFREGKLIYAYLGASESSLATVLQVAGKLSEDQSRIIQTRAKGTSDKQLGHMLIQAKYVTQADIIQSVRQYVLDIVYKLFTWAEGQFRFDANILPSTDRITIPIDLESVIMEGSRRLKEWEVLQDEIPELGVAIQFTDKPDARLNNVNLTVEEWRVVSFINPKNTIEQIARANNLSDFEIRRIVYGMLQAGLVDFVGPRIKIEKRKKTNLEKAREEKEAEQNPALKRSVVVRLIDRIRGL